MTSYRARSRRNPSPRDDGQITAYVVVFASALVLLIGLVFDGGLTLSARERAMDEAQEAARAGAQGINLTAYRASGTLELSNTVAVADAETYLNRIGAAGVVTVTGNVVTVTVTIVQPMQILEAAGLRAVTVHGTASAEPVRGISVPLP